MSRENGEIVQRIFEAFDRRDIDAVVESATADLLADRPSAGASLLGIRPPACGARCRVIGNPSR